MTLRIHLLGSPQLSEMGKPIDLPGYRPLALLAYLLVTARAHSRQHLVDLLFDNTDDPRASLRWTLSKLRQAIGPDYILADRHEITFNFESDYWLDLTAFEAGQLDLYRGDFLEGLHLRDAYRFEDWLFFERERLRASYQSALEQRLAEAEGRGNDPAVVELAHQLLRLDNLHEDWYRALMGAYARQGQREAALAQFELCRQVLQAELGVEPVAETVALAEAIQRGHYQPARLAPDLDRQLIAGRYAMDDPANNWLGQGGMAEVYRGKDTQTGEPVAIKVIKSDLAASRPDLLQRFIREGEALRRLNHPHIVKMLAAAEKEGRHYLVMEYVEGGSLRDLLQAQGRLPVQRVLEIALDLADALTRAHRLNIIHRDLKPENVLLAADDTPRIADFGIAQISDSPPLTETGLVLGTLDYLSPEACQGESLDSRTDIWAFGVMIYELLTGQHPFTGETLAATLTAILTQPVPDLVQQRPETPAALVRLVHHMLEKEPDRRLATVRLVGAELEAILKGRGREAEEQGGRRAEIISPLPHFTTSLVGRAAEMATLRQVWQRVKTSTGQIILVEGEPGIGKTRLIEELLAEAGAEAFILRAKCPELQEPLAYTLFVGPLRDALAGERPPGLSNTWLAEVSRLLPELHDRYPNLPHLTPSDPAAERRRLFDAICTTLLAWTQRRPLIFFVDDLQWADPTSLALLNHWSSGIAAAPVLVIGAYRLHEVGAQHPLQELRRDWTRTGILTNLALSPLSNQAVNELLRQLTTWGGEDASFGNLIYRETGGNPLFVVETIASLRDEGRLPQTAEDWQRDFRTDTVTIPPQVQTLIGARLNRLDELSRQVITAAAVMRSSFEADLVQEVSGRSEWETLEGLERLLAGGLLVEQGGDRFTFSHDKIREVAYGSLSQLRRKLLHRRVAETLESRGRGQEKTVAGRLAYHYERAGVADKALDYYLQAGQMERDQYAHESAIGHYKKALALLKEQGDYERAARTLMQLGLIYHQAFDFQGAHQAYEEGFALWQSTAKAQPASPLPPAPHALRLCMGTLPTIDPTMCVDPYSAAIVDQLFSGLAETNPGMDVVPDVAQSWEVLEGGRTYIFHLRSDVFWSDGMPVTAKDFEYAWKRILHPATESPAASLLYDLKGARAFHQAQVSDPDQVGVRTINPLTLLVELEEPTGYFFYLLATQTTRPVPRHVVETYGESWTAVEKIVTNGPFRLQKWQQGASINLTRSPTYHGRFTGNIQQVDLSLSKDWPALLALYERDNLDVLPLTGLVFFPAAEIDAIRQRHSGEYISIPSLISEAVGFNMSQAPFDNPRVRRAFALAIDRDRWANEIERGHVSPATGGFIPPGMPGHSAGIGLPYNPSQARHLLAEAGYPSGHGFPPVALWWPTVLYSTLECEQLQTQWQENLGITIEYERMEMAVFLDRMERELPSLFSSGWMADYPDPDNFLRVGAPSVQHGWRNETYHRLIKEAKQLTDQVERLKLYRQADKILVEEAAILPLTYERFHLLVKPWVKKYPTSPIQRWFWKDVIIEPH